MPAIDFPNSPTVNDEFTANGRTWVWTGTTWNTVETESFKATQVIESKSSNYSLTAADAGKLIINSAAIVITVQGLAVGKQVDFLQNVAGQITFQAGVGMTLNSKGGNLKTAAQYSLASIRCIATNTYILVGDIGA